MRFETRQLLFLCLLLSCLLFMKVSGQRDLSFPNVYRKVEYGGSVPVQNRQESNAGNTHDPLHEPANYDFQYEIYGGGNSYGHLESRRDQKATGKYHVLLPDGRRQVVTYYADETGYHPTITYEVASTDQRKYSA